ncbi:MAG: TIGR01440 family protein [Thermoanaerobacteraceae bacterium]|nr:TIGR01440 family protein [Thermoanaerobacteraceae bacterium]
MDLNVISKETRIVIRELLDIADIKKEGLFVLGGSTSEVLGKKVGTAGSLDIAKAVIDPVLGEIRERGLYLAIQCCEHLNRALLVEEKAQEKYNLDVVTVIPQVHAGGSFATYAYDIYEKPVMVENLKSLAYAGIDIGLVLIGMHLRPVAVPVRLSQNKIGEADIVAAITRPKLIGGERAVYKR